MVSPHPGMLSNIPIQNGNPTIPIQTGNQPMIPTQNGSQPTVPINTLQVNNPNMTS